MCIKMLWLTFWQPVQYKFRETVLMLVRVNGNSGKPTTSNELSALSRERVLSSDFCYHRGAEIYGEGEPAEFIYQIIEGAIRSYKLLADGRRQIGAFHLPGDIFGVENAGIHRFTAEAIVDTSVRLLRRRGVDDVAEGDASVMHDLLDLTTKNLEHAENHMLLLGRKTALERTAAFLVEMDRRLAGTDVMVLPMNRQDIADYLGLTLETVSRALSTLHGEGVLTFVGQTQRRIALLNRGKLTQAAA
jgi:CRP/FNR family transcriptional regulator, nitrogen fixation regulation protein